MPSVYCGVEDFVVQQTGDAMANAIREAAANVDPGLADLLALDPESSGLEIAMPSEDHLMIVLDIAVHQGLIAASFVESLDPEELEDLGGDEWAGEHGAFVGPMNIRGVTDDGVVGAFNAASFPRGEAPAGTIPGLLDHARRVLGSEPWARRVALSTTNDHVLVEAPDVVTLERAAKALGTPGLPTFADDLVRVMRAERERGGPNHAPRDWVARQSTPPAGAWVARGSVGDITAVYVEGDPVRASNIVLEHLDGTGADSADRIDVSIEPDWTVVILGDARGDVEWAADELRRPAA